MSRSKILALALLGASTVALSGCGVIYSRQNYGSPNAYSVSKDASRADVFFNLGQPNAVFKAADGGEVFVYRHTRGTNVLGLYANINRTDTIVVLSADGIVSAVQQIDIGEGTTILAAPWFDATHPVRTETLEFKPDNYTYNAEVEGGSKGEK